MNLPGIEFLLDRKGRTKAALIDMKKHKELWEDLFDAYVAHRRRNEGRYSLASVKGSSTPRRRASHEAEYTVLFARSARKELQVLDPPVALRILKHMIRPPRRAC